MSKKSEQAKQMAVPMVPYRMSKSEIAKGLDGLVGQRVGVILYTRDGLYLSTLCRAMLTAETEVGGARSWEAETEDAIVYLNEEMDVETDAKHREIRVWPQGRDEEEKRMRRPEARKAMIEEMRTSARIVALEELAAKLEAEIKVLKKPLATKN